MIALVLPLSVGNALRVFLEPPAGALRWRVLRKGADTFTGETDPNAFVVYEGTDKSVVDAQYLQNGTLYHYRAYYWDGAVWVASATATGTPIAEYQDHSTDALTVLRDRLDYGLQVEVARGTLRHENGSIPVLTAPPVFDDTRWPVVTVHLASEAPGVRAIGELADSDVFDVMGGDWSEFEGWLAKVQITVVGWCLNPDERIALRKALRRIVVANLAVFDSRGMVEVEFSQQDIEDFESYSAPVYHAMCSFTCLAPIVVSDQVPAITDVQTSISAD